MYHESPTKRLKRVKGVFEKIIAENFHHLGKETDIQIQEVQRTPIKINKSRTPRHIIIKFAKYSNKEKNHKSSKTKEVPNLQGKMHKGSSKSLHRNVASQKGVA